MKCIIDVEANALKHPSKIWCIVCREVNTERYHVFRSTDKSLESFEAFAAGVDQFIGHNILGWDCNVILNLLGVDLFEKSLDTYLLSKLIDYPRKGHSIEDYGIEFGIEKGKHNDFSKWSQELEGYCIRDVDITHRIYSKYSRYVSNKLHHPSIQLEHEFQRVVNNLNRVGFAFNSVRGNVLLDRVVSQLKELDKEILDVFRPRLVLVKEVHPRITQHGTLNRSDFRWHKSEDLSEFNGGAFCRCTWKDFNPSSHRQIIDVLHEAGWKPNDRTRAHIDAVRTSTVNELHSKYGWRVNEANLNTLPPNAPKPARLLSKRILLESRRRTLTEWMGLVSNDGRIHGDFYGIGAWTHRMSHSNPNMANIPTGDKLYAKEMRGLFKAPRNRLLVGVDAEGIQLRIFAHYINDPEFTKAIVEGKKSNKTDPHSLNQSILGDICKTRDIAKRYIYALLLGGSHNKLAEILGCEVEDARRAYDRLITRYKGLAVLKEKTIPADARRGWFVGLDGRRVRIPGETQSERRHLAMSGYLQNGEAVVMKHATVKWHNKLWGQYAAYLVNLVHDEWQTECPNNFTDALALAKVQSTSLEEVGKELGLRCPLTGSYWSDTHNDYSIGINWSYTH